MIPTPTWVRIDRCVRPLGRLANKTYWDPESLFAIDSAWD
jgi:hypothetical protein